MLVPLGNTYVDPDMITLIVPREEGGTKIFMKKEAGGAVLNLTESTVQETYDWIELQRARVKNEAPDRT